MRGARLLLVASVLALVAARPAAAAAAAMPFAGPAVDREQLAILVSPGAISLYDVVELANPQPQALQAVTLPLAAGARDVQVRQGGDGAGAKVGADGLTVPVNLPPGGHATVAFSYDVPVSGLPATLRRQVTLPTAALLVLMRADQAALQTASLADLGVSGVGGLQLRQYGAEAIPPGTPVSFTVVPPPSWASAMAARFTPGVWLVVAAAALGGLLLLGLRRDAAPAAGGGAAR